jgi:membrane-bound lytic murein transglycosylase C
VKVTTTQLANGAKKITVSVPFKADYLSESAKRYQEQVMIEAQRRGLPASLVYAIMETESHFNPRARSHIPAFGLMQLVPSSGGLDAYNYVYGEKLVLGPEYYFNPDQNVELGTAYLDLLLSRYLRAIEDEQSRVYCAIAAYNTGAGNVARSFTGNTSVSGAAPMINDLTPQEVFDHMVVNLPYEETRNYLRKVTKARERYRGLDQPSV